MHHSYRVNEVEDKLDQMDYAVKRLEQTKGEYLANLQKLPARFALIQEIENKVNEINFKIARPQISKNCTCRKLSVRHKRKIRYRANHKRGKIRQRRKYRRDYK